MRCCVCNETIPPGSVHGQVAEANEIEMRRGRTDGQLLITKKQS